MKKLIGLIGLSLMFGMTLTMFVGCSQARTDHVMVLVKEEYAEKYSNQEFALEDFEWENIKEITYNKPPFITVILKETGIKFVKDAVKHLEKLEFVKEARLCYSCVIPQQGK